MARKAAILGGGLEAAMAAKALYEIGFRDIAAFAHSYQFDQFPRHPICDLPDMLAERHADKMKKYSYQLVGDIKTWCEKRYGQFWFRGQNCMIPSVQPTSYYGMWIPHTIINDLWGDADCNYTLRLGKGDIEDIASVYPIVIGTFPVPAAVDEGLEKDWLHTVSYSITGGEETDKEIQQLRELLAPPIQNDDNFLILSGREEDDWVCKYCISGTMYTYYQQGSKAGSRYMNEWAPESKPWPKKNKPAKNLFLVGAMATREVSIEPDEVFNEVIRIVAEEWDG